jgi:hypothetical protein
MPAINFFSSIIDVEYATSCSIYCAWVRVECTKQECRVLLDRGISAMLCPGATVWNVHI